MFNNLRTLIKELEQQGQVDTISVLLPVLKDSQEPHKHIGSALTALERLANNGNLIAKQCLIDELESSSWDVRRTATKILIKIIQIGDVELITLLGEFLKSADDWDAKKNVLEILGYAKREDIFDILINASSDKNEFVASQAIESLGTMNDIKALPNILSALERDSEHIKISVVIALGKIWDENVVEPLNKIISGNVSDLLYNTAYKALANIRLQSMEAFGKTDIDTKQKAIKILGLMGGKDVVSYLIAALTDTDLRIQHSAVSALENQKDIKVMEALQPLLKNKDTFIRLKIIDILTKNFAITEKTANLLLKAVNDESPKIRHRALNELNKYHFAHQKDEYTFLPVIISAIDDKDESIRQFIAEVLGDYYDRESIKGLNKLLKDACLNVRNCAGKSLHKIVFIAKKHIEKKDKEKIINAVNILGQCSLHECCDILFDQLDTDDLDIKNTIINCVKNKGEEILDFLFDKLKTATNIKQDVVKILGAYKTENTIDILITLLKDKDPKIRAEAINSLKNIGRTALPFLLKTLRSERVVVRRSAVYLVGAIGKTDVLHNLLPFLRDSNLSIIRATINVLKQIGDVYSINSLIRLKKEKKAAILENLINSTILEIGNKACEGFKQGKQRIPIEAVATLGKVPTPSIREFLITFLKDENQAIQRITLDSLINMPHSILIPHFIELLELKDEDIGDLARDGLIKIGKESKEWEKDVINNLISVITTKNKTFQARAIEIFGKLKAKETSEYIHSVLMDGDEKLSMLCTETLYEFELTSIPYLIKVLNSDKWDVRSNAKRILIRFGKPCIPYLIDVLKQENEQARQEAEDMLYIIGEDGVNEFISIFNNEKEQTIRDIIIRVLGTIEDKNAFLTLIKTINDSNLKVRQSAILALKNFAEFVNNEIDTASSLGFEDVGIILKQQHEDFIHSLVISLKDSDSVTARIIAETLSKMGEITVEPLLELLGSKNDENIKPMVITILGEVGSIRPLNQLLELLPDSPYQVDIIKALGKIKDKKAIHPLGELLHKSKDKSIKIAIIRALGQIKDLEILDYIRDLIKSNEPEIKIAVLNTLADIGSEKVLNLILSSLNDKNNQVQIAANTALSKINSPQIIPHLISALEKELPITVQVQIIETLGNIKTIEAIEILLKKLKLNTSPEVKNATIKTLAQIGEPEIVIKNLLPLVKDNDIRVSYGTITTLGNLGELASLDDLKLLTKITGKTMKDWIIRSSAKDSVEKIRKRYSS